MKTSGLTFNRSACVPRTSPFLPFCASPGGERKSHF
jgi:hypothetical protein